MPKPLALIVEDDPDAATIFSKALQAAGFETEVAWAGDIAMNRLDVVEPRVIVVDMHLPNVAGSNILKRIRSDERLTHSQIIIATADARMAEAAQEPSDYVFLKPISFSQLRDLAMRLRSSAIDAS